MSKVKEYNAKIAEIEQRSLDTKSFFLELNEELDFKAGQYVFIKTEKDGRPFLKPYSIASSPSSKKVIEIVLNKVPNGYFSTFMHEKVREGDEFVIKAPLGLFTLREPIENDLIFVATGTGIGPLRSMIYRALEIGIKKNLWLFFGERHEEDLLYRKEFEELSEKNENFKFIPTLSRQEWDGETGYVQKAIKKYIDNVENKEVYICGLQDMILDTRKLLQEMGFDRNKVYFEKYD